MVLSSQQKEIILWIAGVVATVALLLLLSIPLERAAEREPASTSKQEVLNRTHSHTHMQGKGGGSLVINVTAPAKKPIDVGSAIDLQATVEALSSLSGLKFKWIIPDGITVESGDAQGELGSIGEGETKSLGLRVVSQVADNRQIHLHVYREVGGESMGEIAQYNTVLQEKINEEIDRKAEVLKASSEDESQSPPKMIH